MDNLGTLARLFRYIFDDYHEFANRFFFCKMHKQFRGIPPDRLFKFFGYFS